MAPPEKASGGCGLLVCGGAVMDHVVRPFDSKQHGASFTSMPGEARVSPGGVGRNIAEVASRLGSPVALLGAVGDDAPGRALLHGCGERGIDVQALEVLEDSRTATYTALLDGKGELVGAVAAYSARRQRMLKRPSYDRPTGKNAQVNFLNCPTDGGPEHARSDRAGPMRGSIKRCRKPQQLMNLIDEAVTKNMLEPSIFGAVEIDVISDAEVLNSFFSSALKLATCLRSEAARAWALGLWDRARALSFSISGITYSTYIQFLEQYRLYDQVDALLEDAEMSQALNYIVLSGLLEQVSFRKDWERAEILWTNCTAKGVMPNLICVLARAKVHLLAGRPTAVLEILQSGMDLCGSCFEENGRLVQEYAQSLLIASHSSLDPQVLRHLREFLDDGHFSIEKKTSFSMRNGLKQMKALAEMLLSSPNDLRLHDLLVEWKAKEMSVMAKWDNFRAGTKYLDD
ncbi:psuK [Symbiodinium sp. CCMP2592]|nr:psuK [Symbiodinium sp. CCMP2592]